MIFSKIYKKKKDYILYKISEKSYQILKNQTIIFYYIIAKIFKQNKNPLNGIFKFFNKKYDGSPTRNRTQICGFGDRRSNHWTMGLKTRRLYKKFFKSQSFFKNLSDFWKIGVLFQNFQNKISTICRDFLFSKWLGY